MDGITIVQTVDATVRSLDVKSNPVIGWIVLGMILLGFVLVIISPRRLFNAGIILGCLGILIGFFGLIEFNVYPKTNYVIICDETVTVSELTQKYKIIEQVGNSLVVTNRYSSSPEETKD